MAMMHSIRDYFDRKVLVHAFSRLIKRHAALGQSSREWRGLEEEERLLLDEAVEAGLPGLLRPGVVDGLVQTPELALILLKVGAVPSDAMVCNLQRILDARALFSRLRNDAQCNTPEGQMLLLVRTAADLHPQLDWFGLADKEEKEGLKRMRIFGLNLHVNGLCEQVLQRRKEAGLLLGPNCASKQDCQDLVDEVLTPYTNSHYWFPHPARRQLVLDMIDKGADPNGKAKATISEAPMSVLARALRVMPQAVAGILERGARVDTQVLGEAAYMLHDRQHPCFKEEAAAGFVRMIDAHEGKVDLEMIVPSEDYLRPSLGMVLKKHYPELWEDIAWRRDAQALGEGTIEVSTPNRAGPRF